MDGVLPRQSGKEARLDQSSPRPRKGSGKVKPIRVFFSPLSRRFYATRAYRVDAGGVVAVTGEKFDVTNDIANLIAEHNIEFQEINPEAPVVKT